MAGWDPLSNLLRMELIQRREEGCDVTGFEARIEAMARSFAFENCRVQPEKHAILTKYAKGTDK